MEIGLRVYWITKQFYASLDEGVDLRKANINAKILAFIIPQEQTRLAALLLDQ